jgi:hypothetical protein
MNKEKTEQTRKAVLVCSGANGRAVVYGYVDRIPAVDEGVTIHDARMILEWSGRSGLFGVAARGPADGSRLTAAVSSVVCRARQVLEVAPEAAQVLDGWPSA